MGEIEELKKVKRKKGKAASVFKLRNKVLGDKKEKSDPTAIVHPESGELVTSHEMIKATTLEYCKNVLKKQPIEEK